MFLKTTAIGLFADEKTPSFFTRNSVAMNLGSSGTVKIHGATFCINASYSRALIRMSRFVTGFYLSLISFIAKTHIEVDCRQTLIYF